MSGILGIYYPDGQPVHHRDLKRMGASIAHRGPDGEGVWRNGHVGLGHRMLWTTPESLQERLPRVSATHDLALTADARIDNRDELIVALGLCDRPAREITDSQLILAAYEKWETSCPEKLIGDFAFAVWDGYRQQLFCARDPMGIKPFYYYHAANAYVFASEIKAVLCLPEVPHKLNEMKIADGLIPIFDEQISTYYQDIFRLPPAHSLTIRHEGVRLQPYWSLDPSHELHLSSDQAYIDAFRELFIEAVRCRLRSAFPVGSTLSGGLDSSAIACTAEKLLTAHGGHRLNTFSAIFPSVAVEDPRIDERPFIEAVLATGAFEPHYVRGDCCYPLSDVALYQEEVLAAPNLYMVSPLLRAAHEHGVRVLLSGFDGDVTVSYGYEYLEELAQTGRWTDFAREAHALSQRFGGKPLSYLQHYGVQYLTELASQQRWWAFAKQAGEISAHFALSRQRLLLNAGLRPLLPQWLWRVRHRFRGPVQPPASMWGLNRAIHPAFAQRICLAERIQAFETTKSSSAHRLREQHLDSIMSGFMQYLGGMFDQIAATCALEQRYPFFDRRLVEFCLALPFEQKLRHGWTRAILRRAMEGFVPPTIQWRTDKGNLSLNIRRRLLAERETLDAVIWHDPSSIEAYVDVPVLRGAYHRYLSQLAATSEEDLFTIYLSVTLALWLRQSESFLAKNSWL